MFSCRDATHLHTEEREGALEGWIAAKYRFHMLLCLHCRRCRRQLEEAVALAKQIPPGETPADTEEKALAAFRARGAR